MSVGPCSVVSALAVTLTLLAPSPVAAQEREPPSVAWPIVGGLGLGAAGFLAGGLIGGAIASGCVGSGDDGLCVLGGVVVGAAIGESVGMAIGVHVGNRRRGNLGFDLLTATGVALVGLALLSDDAAIFIFPAIQLAATVAIERGNAAAKARRRRVEVGAFVPPGGGLGLGATLRF